MSQEILKVIKDRPRHIACNWRWECHIDLAAEEAIAAEKAGRKIAVEVKSFASSSAISEFHTALGQFLNYRIALEASEEPDRIL